uniref:Uncharacterized protein n=1 Tax=Salarias fasciatus TaxID=181472 RepID=A0A672IGW7_SALFA
MSSTRPQARKTLVSLEYVENSDFPKGLLPTAGEAQRSRDETKHIKTQVLKLLQQMLADKSRVQTIQSLLVFLEMENKD